MECCPFQLEYARALEKSLAKKAVFLFVALLFHRFTFECQEGEEIPAEEDSDLGILRNCKPFKIRAITRN